MVAIPFSLHRNQPTIQPINQLYIFGDSLSDVGNVFRSTGGIYPAPPYFQGRHSNGQVWVEELATRLNLSGDHVKNLAWGGATTARTGLNGVPGLLAQVDQFTRTTPQVDPQALCVVWAGANDYLFSTENPQLSIDNLNQALQSLLKTGAKRFLVANLPNLGELPATRNTVNSKALTTVAIAYNQALTALLDRIKQPNLVIAQLDVFSIYRDAVADPQKFGFTNVTNACLGTSNQCDRFLFWDGIHPTTTAHKILGDRAFEQIESAIALASR